MYRVYKITNLKNNKSYIGITSRKIEERFSEHVSRAKQNLRNSRLYAAMRKYGKESFIVEEIDNTDSEDDVRSMETIYIKKHNTYENGYNANYGGCGHLHIPDELKMKISLAQKGKIVSKECRRKMSAAKIGDKRCAKHLGNHTKKGAGNPAAKYALIKTPSGKCIVVKGINAFCKENDLAPAHFYCRGRTKGFVLMGTFNDYPEREYTQAGGSGGHP